MKNELEIENERAGGIRRSRIVIFSQIPYRFVNSLTGFLAIRRFLARHPFGKM
jgi:hypothetical protein